MNPEVSNSNRPVCSTVYHQYGLFQMVLDVDSLYPLRPTEFKSGPVNMVDPNLHVIDPADPQDDCQGIVGC